MSERKKLLTVTKKDFEWDYYRGSGAGGQHRNKKDTAVRCRHLQSGGMGQSQDERSQHQNKVLAWRRCVNSKQFRDWIKRESAMKAGLLDDIEEKVEAMMKQVRVEVQENGKWVEE